jgi:gamma-glutamylcyclotransferase (GGCT)/AIG2-like uncharacterized protein YtfP
MTEHLFTYGTLQKEKVQQDLFGRILKGSGDALKGYRTATIEIKDLSFLSRGEQKYQLIAIHSNDKDDHIKGKVLEITGEELFLADQYEPNGYKRVKVTLESGKDAWMYVAVETV